MLFDENFVKQSVPGVQCAFSGDFENAEFCVDSRQVKKGDIFVALEGDNVNGHDFVKDVLHAGAGGVIISHDKKNVLNSIDKKILKKKTIIIVDDPLKALISLASGWRKMMTCPVVGVTGSVGKTSTKEIISNILLLHGVDNIVSRGNQNTIIGLSMNILRVRPNHKVAIFEMGVSKRNEMRELADLAKPVYAIVTGIGHSHLQGLGSLADIAIEKRHIFDFFKKDGVGVINGDQKILTDVAYPHPVVTFGCKMTNRIQARKIKVTDGGTKFVLKMYREKFEVTLPSPHDALVYNALGAAAITHLLGVPSDVIAKAIELPTNIKGRFNTKELKFVPGKLIDDCYNASPESMKSALLALEKISTSARKVAVLGDMLELGVNSPFWHRQLGRFLRKVPSLDKVVLVGKMIEWTKKTAPLGLELEVVKTWKDAALHLKENVKDESVVLVKGSRGMGLDNLVRNLTE
ncbi:UDP-N-acetylmuramoyl-tripeptide--D-alanyl-D-alanine ligase [bacterium]|jgi:UDP-N-acetylmuramoyl-tripeptide--D-alanyl-D-alanine ligase|nr:UDP-N-acetylmuramoyl-tripeptide--D-alanyl-D-alanine ligase [bacterium]